MAIILVKKYSIILFGLGMFIFSIGLLLPFNIRNVAVISLGAFLIINISYIRKISELALINFLYFIVILLSLAYTTNFDIGLKRVLVILPIFILPISFSIILKKEIINYNKWFNIILKVFFISTIIFFIGILVHNLFNGFVNENIFVHFGERLNTKFEKYSIHPLYASLHVSIALILSLPMIKNTKGLKYKFVLIIMDLFLILVLILLARKGPILITFILLIVVHFSQERDLKYIFMYVILLLCFIILIVNIVPLRIRFLELFNTLLDNKTNNIGSTLIRLNIYDCSIDAIKNAPFFGYGIGDVGNILQKCYTTKETIFKGKFFNSHNQFLGAWLSAGILGIASLLILFFYNLKRAFKAKDIVYFSILILFFFMMLTENILDRQNGVLLFAFFLNLFAFKNAQKSIE